MNIHVAPIKPLSCGPSTANKGTLVPSLPLLLKNPCPLIPPRPTDNKFPLSGRELNYIVKVLIRNKNPSIPVLVPLST